MDSNHLPIPSEGIALSGMSYESKKNRKNAHELLPIILAFTFYMLAQQYSYCQN